MEGYTNNQSTSTVISNIQPPISPTTPRRYIIDKRKREWRRTCGTSLHSMGCSRLSATAIHTRVASGFCAASHIVSIRHGATISDAVSSHQSGHTSSRYGHGSVVDQHVEARNRGAAARGKGCSSSQEEARSWIGEGSPESCRTRRSGCFSSKHETCCLAERITDVMLPFFPQLPDYYEEILRHPAASDEVRRAAESKILRHYYRFMNCLSRCVFRQGRKK